MFRFRRYQHLFARVPQNRRFPGGCRSFGSTSGVALGAILGTSIAAASLLSFHRNDDDDDDAVTILPGTNTCHCQEQQVPTNQQPTGSTQGGTSTGMGPFRVKDVYDIEKVLGQGSYGLVYQARRKLDGAIVALKTMPREFTGKTDFEREVAALQLLSKPPGHAHIVQFYDLHRDNKNYYLAMELIEGGELFEHLIQHGPYSEGLAATFLRQFAEAICFMHDNGLAHADLKPENLLLSSNDMDKAKLKVVDFGCSCSHDQSRKEMNLPAQEFAAGCSFLHMVALGNQFELERMLQERPSLVNFRDYDFRTPLHLAASEGHVDIVRYLIMKGARVNRSDRWGGSPLDDAHRHRHADVIQYLRQQGATFGTSTQLPRFIQAASEGDEQEVMALLEFGNIDLDEGDYDRRTALHLAAGEGRKEIVELLCKQGANVNVEDRWGNRPLDDAQNAKKNVASIMTLLKRYGAKSSKNPSLGKSILDSLSATLQSKSSVSATAATAKSTEKKKTFSGTIAYWPPELFSDASVPTPASDMWAAGVIMFVLLTGSHPFDKYANLTDDEIEEAIVSVSCDKDNSLELINKLVFDERVEGLSDSAIELMRQLIHPDPQERMTSAKFLRHPWIQGLTASWTTMGKAHTELKAFWRNRFRAEIMKKFAARIGPSGKSLSEKDLADMFRALDLKKQGFLELDEIRAAFRVSDKALQAIFDCADLDGTGVIHFDEFRALLTSTDTEESQTGLDAEYLQSRFKSRILDKFVGKKQEALSDQQKLRKIFNAIDLEGNGVLDPHDIRMVLRSVGEPEDVISRIIASLDLNHDGSVSWTEFLAIMGMKAEPGEFS